MGDSVSVVLPSMTDQMVLGVFKYLVEAELRKIMGQNEFRTGCQEGTIATMGLLFGTSDDLTAEVAFENKKTWIHVIEEIRENLQTWVDTLERAEEFTEIDVDELQDAVDVAVNDYALKYPKKLGDALRINL